jgi:hypothetical protein
VSEHGTLVGSPAEKVGEHFCSSDDIAEHLLPTKTTWKIIGAFALAAAILTILVIVLT